MVFTSLAPIVGDTLSLASTSAFSLRAASTAIKSGTNKKTPYDPMMTFLVNEVTFKSMSERFRKMCKQQGGWGCWVTYFKAPQMCGRKQEGAKRWNGGVLTCGGPSRTLA